MEMKLFKSIFNKFKWTLLTMSIDLISSLFFCYLAKLIVGAYYIVQGFAPEDLNEIIKGSYYLYIPAFFIKSIFAYISGYMLTVFHKENLNIRLISFALIATMINIMGNNFIYNSNPFWFIVLFFIIPFPSMYFGYFKRLQHEKFIYELNNK